MVMYERALAKLDQALEAYRELGDDPAVRRRRSKLIKVRQQILFRFQVSMLKNFIFVANVEHVLRISLIFGT
jgi:hypothetical protein